MNVSIDEPEGQRLELKGRDALANPRKIGAAVVAFLNSEGGDLYVGVREERERAVAANAEIEGVEDADKEARRLWDFLLDAIEPSPGVGEIELSSEPAEERNAVIHLRVTPGKHRPYALLGQGGARSFWVRVGPRNRPMTREELADAFSTHAAVDPGEAAWRLLVGERDELQRTGGEWLWMGIQPVPELEWDLQRPGLRSWLMDPGTIGVRPGSPSFQVPFEPELEKGRLVARAVDAGEVLKETVLRRDGGIRFRSVLDHLYQRETGRGPRLINPDVLIGIPLSLFLLAKALPWGELGGEFELVADLALLGVERAGAGLLPGRWRVPRPGTEVKRFTEEEDLTFAEPLCFRFEEVAENPERCLFRLLRRVYEAFGLREEAMPFSFDPATGLPYLVLG